MKQIIKKFLSFKELRFLIAGGVNTIFSYLCFATLMYLINIKEFAVTINLLICVMFNYFTSSKFVFRDKTINKEKVIKFYGLYLITYILNLIHLRVTVDIWNWNVYIAQLATLLYLPWISFFLQKKIVFINKEDME